MQVGLSEATQQKPFNSSYSNSPRGNTVFDALRPIAILQLNQFNKKIPGYLPN